MLVGQWCKCVRTISDSPDQSSVTAHFDDSTSATGSLIIGCDGARSAVRRLLSSLEHENRQLPVGLVGVSVTYSAQQVEQIRALDPFFLHGTHSDTGAFFWFSCKCRPCSSSFPLAPVWPMNHRDRSRRASVWRC